VNESGLVRLDVTQEVSDATATTTSRLNSPTIQQRRFRSTVGVGDGQTIALGGLIRDRKEEGESGIPLLKDIPILGNVFKTTNDITRRTELLVLITPHVVRGAADIDRITEELRSQLRTPRGG
jgi:general secretion pathway protein D